MPIEVEIALGMTVGCAIVLTVSIVVNTLINFYRTFKMRPRRNITGKETGEYEFDTHVPYDGSFHTTYLEENNFDNRS